MALWAVISAFATAVLFVSSYVNGAAYTVSLVYGAAAYNQYGFFVNYYIFAEVGAPLTPAPVLQINSIATGQKLNLVDIPIEPQPNPRHDRVIRYGRNRTRTLTLTPTLIHHYAKTPTVQIARYGYLTWWVISAPFGALPPIGPHEWIADSASQFTLTDFIFQTAGKYNVGFNLTTLLGTNFKFNLTIHVALQPSQIALTTTVAGYNGSALFPAPSVQMENYEGYPVYTPTVSAFIDFQAVPTGARISGTLTVNTNANGFAAFTDVVPSLPGVYTWRIVATLSDGSTLATSSQQVTVQRALPVQINVLQGVSGLSGFLFYTMPAFSVDDSAGLAQYPNSNMSITISVNNPAFSYSGQNTVATLSGTTVVGPNGFLYNFTDLSIDLPGSYQLTATLSLSSGYSISTTLGCTINQPPTFEVPEEIIVNTAGIISLFGPRPTVSPLYIMLATDQACTQQSSDVVLWSTGQTNAASSTLNANVTIVPFRAVPTYVCLKIPMAPVYAPLIQYYLQQFDEAYPLIYTFTPGTVSTCSALTDVLAAQYQTVGWLSATAGRRYGCALTPPVSGTIAPCSCPSVMTCGQLSDQSFQPPGLNIGQCLCCTAWVLALGSVLTGLFIAGLLYSIYEWV